MLEHSLMLTKRYVNRFTYNQIFNLELNGRFSDIKSKSTVFTRIIVITIVQQVEFLDTLQNAFNCVCVFFKRTQERCMRDFDLRLCKGW